MFPCSSRAMISPLQIFPPFKRDIDARVVSKAIGPRWRMELRLPRPDKMCRVGRLKPGISRLRETQTLFSTFPPTPVVGRRRDEIEIVDVEAENAQQP